MSRQNTLPVALLVAVLACAAVIYLSTQRHGGPTTVVIAGSASPTQPSSAAIAPHVDETSGLLTIGLGDSVDSNGVLVGATSVVAPYTSPQASPRSGEFMLVNVEVHNSRSPGGNSLTISSGDSFELQDATGRSYRPTS
ncbi:MAG TPA: hypothetical protein VF157_05685, partial [Chloroflexota bacterium]